MTDQSKHISPWDTPVVRRFRALVAIDTQSDESQSGSLQPSTPGQWELSDKLMTEMRSMGLQRVRRSEFGYTFGELPASPGWEAYPALGLLAHMDTSDAASGKGVRPQQIESYDGGVISLGTSGRVLDPQRFPVLNRCIGDALMTTDGTTLLGADDKAGIAEILTAVEELIASGAKHGKICIGFTPDEEIGEGTRHFDVADFGAAYAYTVDGGAAGEIEYQNFNAAAAEVVCSGVSVHPGSAKGIMRNAMKVAMAFLASLPERESPENTEEFEGFYHLTQCRGDVSQATLKFIIRDHDRAKFEQKKAFLVATADALNAQNHNLVRVTLRDQYFNMESVILQHPWLVTAAKQAMDFAGLTARVVPIRGGTDGAMLSFMGLPCPNLGTGGYLFHGEYEFLSVSGMLRTVTALRHLMEIFPERQDRSLKEREL